MGGQVYVDVKRVKKANEALKQGRNSLAATSDLIGGMHAAKWYARTGDQFAIERPAWAEWVKAGKV